MEEAGDRFLALVTSRMSMSSSWNELAPLNEYREACILSLPELGNMSAFLTVSALGRLPWESGIKVRVRASLFSHRHVNRWV